MSRGSVWFGSGTALWSTAHRQLAQALRTTVETRALHPGNGAGSRGDPIEVEPIWASWDSWISSPSVVRILYPTRLPSPIATVVSITIFAWFAVFSSSNSDMRCGGCVGNDEVRHALVVDLLTSRLRRVPEEGVAASPSAASSLWVDPQRPEQSVPIGELHRDGRGQEPCVGDKRRQRRGRATLLTVTPGVGLKLDGSVDHPADGLGSQGVVHVGGLVRGTHQRHAKTSSRGMPT